MHYEFFFFLKSLMRPKIVNIISAWRVCDFRGYFECTTDKAFCGSFRFRYREMEDGRRGLLDFAFYHSFDCAKVACALKEVAFAFSLDLQEAFLQQ
jgi:hypothetical protein